MTVVDRLTIGGQLLGRFSGLALLEAFDSIDLMAISFPSRTHLWLYSFQRCVAQDAASATARRRRWSLAMPSPG
jgi:hypothetical protein